MKRRSFLARSAAVAVGGAALFRAPFAAGDVRPEGAAAPFDPKLARDWLKRWEQSILKSGRQRYCDRETGEEIGWLVSPFLNGFYEGYHATGDVRWIERLADWAEAADPEQRWLTGFYLDEPREWDDPYRFFRW